MKASQTPCVSLYEAEEGGAQVAFVLRALKVGDLLVAVPALRAIRRALPDHRVVLGAPRWLNPLVSALDVADVQVDVAGLGATLPVAAPVDIGIDLHGNGPASAELLRELGPRRLIAELYSPPGPELHQRHRWLRLLALHGIVGDPLDYRVELPDEAAGDCVVHVGAAFASRHWPLDRFAEVAVWIAHAGYGVTIAGGPNDAERVRAVVDMCRVAGVAPRALVAHDVGSLMRAVAAAPLVVSVDNGCVHLASAYGRPSVSLFGPSPVSSWGPPPGPHIALAAATAGSGLVFASEPDPALLAITVADVLAAAVRLGALANK